MNTPTISVVVPTYRRRDCVVRLLTAMTRQTLDPSEFEVIISIDGSEDGTYEAVAGFESMFALKAIKYPNRGRAAACNSGIREARGDLLVILDDDMEPEPWLLAEHVRAHSARDRLGVLGAVPIYVGPDAPPTLKYIGAKFNAHLEKLASPGYSLQLRDFYTGNFSIPRKIMLAVGGYDEVFRVYGNEDLELSLRLKKAGVWLVYCPKAAARQTYTKDLTSLAKDNINKGRTAVLLVAMHPEARPYLRLGMSQSYSIRWRAFRRALLALSRVWPRTPRAVVHLVEWVARVRPGALNTLYDLALDYFFWLGANAALKRPGAIADRSVLPPGKPTP